MKHLYIILCVLTFGMVIHVTYGQCENNVSTDHYSPLNAHLSNNNPHLTPYDDLFRYNA
ncbi:hypothetical protein [Brumimicrobium mesophilum]|uniref:hypothetical protein n=1 Tax=Brumimicrobium mesophilum TaxID=392717 RepID=UPI00131EB72A|nr:hypothetical protein [Brumimicrobium mesophilum]